LEHVCLKQRPLQATHRILIPLLTVPEGILERSRERVGER
jgi:hypothetical protein